MADAQRPKYFRVAPELHALTRSGLPVSVIVAVDQWQRSDYDHRTYFFTGAAPVAPFDKADPFCWCMFEGREDPHDQSIVFSAVVLPFVPTLEDVRAAIAEIKRELDEVCR